MILDALSDRECVRARPIDEPHDPLNNGAALAIAQGVEGMPQKRAVVFLFAVLVLAFLSRGELPSTAQASHDYGMAAMSLDLDPQFTPANTATTLGTSEPCARINENDALDADEDLIDTVLLDVTADGVPDYNPMTGYSYSLTYDASDLQITSWDYNFMLFSAPGSQPPIVIPPELPDTDGTWSSSMLDPGPPSSAESGDGVLERIGLSSRPGAVTGVLPLDLSSTAHRDLNGVAWAPDSTRDALVGLETGGCGFGFDSDGDGVRDGIDNCLSVPNAGQQDNDGGGGGDACDSDDDNDGYPDTSDNCPLRLNPNQANYDAQYGDTMGDTCDPEDDGDGYLDTVEVHIGTNPLDNCGDPVVIPPHSFPTSSSWPPDLRMGGLTSNRVDISDVATFVVPFRHMNTNPNDTYYDKRWDIVPGPGVFPEDINVADMYAVINAYPLMFGGSQRAFQGPPCTP